MQKKGKHNMKQAICEASRNSKTLRTKNKERKKLGN